jgi:hypothetical protein
MFRLAFHFRDGSYELSDRGGVVATDAEQRAIEVQGHTLERLLLA